MNIRKTLNHAYACIWPRPNLSLNFGFLQTVNFQLTGSLNGRTQSCANGKSDWVTPQLPRLSLKGLLSFLSNDVYSVTSPVFRAIAQRGYEAHFAPACRRSHLWSGGREYINQPPNQTNYQFSIAVMLDRHSNLRYVIKNLILQQILE